MARNVKTSTAIQELPRRRPWWEVMQKGDVLAAFPSKEEWRERLIYSLYKWSDSEDALTMEQFYREHRIARRRMYEMCELYPDINKAVEEVRIYVANNRRVSAMKKGLDSFHALRGIQKLDPEEIENDNYEDERKIKIAKAAAESRVEATEKLAAALAPAVKWVVEDRTEPTRKIEISAETKEADAE